MNENGKPIALPWEDEKARRFVNNVALIASNGKYKYNFMSCEWAHQISYNPARIAISINKEAATLENIRETGYFGVSLLDEEKAIVASICGNLSAKDVDKIALLKFLGYKLVKGKVFDLLFLEDSCLNLECKKEREIDVDDHVLIIGLVFNAEMKEKKKPLLYHEASYWKIGEKIKKPEKEKIDKINAIVEKFRRK